MHTPFSMLHPLAMLHPLYTPYQAHAFTCSTRRGSLGQHFRVLGGEGGGGSSEGGADQLPPPLAAALAILHRFDWVGLTDLYDQSVCLLHYQANGSLPAACNCAYGPIRLGLPRFTHGVVRHDATSLSAETLALIDAHSQVRRLLSCLQLYFFAHFTSGEP